MNPKTRQYLREYKWSNILAMLKNNLKEPKICTERFQHKLVVITGATSGIGYATARKYASQGANLLCVNRNLQRSERLKAELEKEFRISCEFRIADLSKLSEIFRVSQELSELEQPIDVLIHNAGIYLTKRELTAEGYDKVFVVHYLASFMMNYLLMEKLKAQSRARIIMVGSEGHRFAVWGLRLDDLNWEKRRYTGLQSYGSAKTAQLLSTLSFSELFRGSGVTINTMHPGAVKSATGQDNGPLYRWFKRNLLDRGLKAPETSAEALYYLGVSQEVEGLSGKFFNLTSLEEPAPPALDREMAKQLWTKTLKLTRLHTFGVQ
ncbi:MAG TPA: SDR family NAD(P)-dependent oxidoreductase [Candidatus Cloacimonadota bacterium]|nr:SDR family NAD(P)-dependent oxidoreductase [Candidatus Cloacimonadota bacterium]